MKNTPENLPQRTLILGLITGAFIGALLAILEYKSEILNR